MAAVSEEDLQKIRDENEKKRAKLLDVQSRQSEQEANRLRELEATQLEAESVRLDAQLAQAQAAAKVGTTKEGASNVLDAAKQELANAKAVAEAPPREPEPEPESTPQPGDALPGDKSEGGNS